MVIGLVGLAAMASLHSGTATARCPGTGVHGGMAHGVGMPASTPGPERTRRARNSLLPADAAHESRWRFLPSSRGRVQRARALRRVRQRGAARVPSAVARGRARRACVPALLVERFAGAAALEPALPLPGRAELAARGAVLSEARAVVPFRNGRGHGLHRRGTAAACSSPRALRDDQASAAGQGGRSPA